MVQVLSFLISHEVEAVFDSVCFPGVLLPAALALRIALIAKRPETAQGKFRRGKGSDLFSPNHAIRGTTSDQHLLETGTDVDCL